MPVLRRTIDESGYYAQASSRDDNAQYALAVEGQRFLTEVLGLKAGDEFSARDLGFLLDRGWASLIEPEPEAEPADEPPPPPVEPPKASEARPKKSSPGPKPTLNRRTRAREIALQVLYLQEQNPGVDPNEVARFIERRLRDPKLREFADVLVEGVHTHQARIDVLITGVAENWRLDRMAAIDRNILRIGAYEMLFAPDIPTKVAINEALELAKRYSTAQSSRFVNGILDRLQGADTSPAQPPSEDGGESPAGVTEPIASVSETTEAESGESQAS